MTSKPASRSTRATSFAPRSWPSRPGLPMSTRAGMSEDPRLHELAPLTLEHVDHLPDGAIRLGRIDEQRHEVDVLARSTLLQRSERVAHFGGRPGALDLGTPFELTGRALLVELVALHLGLLLVDLEAVEPDDLSPPVPQRHLHPGGLVGDEAVEVAVLDRRDHAALSLEVVHD